MRKLKVKNFKLKVAMSKGYVEMAEINLTTSQEYFIAESEGVEIFSEMVTEDSKG